MPNEVRGGNVWGISPVSPEKIDSVRFDIFHPRVHIYKGLLPSVEKFVKILKKSGEDRSSSYYFNQWDKWHVFGETIGGIRFNPIYPDIVDTDKKIEEESILKEIEDAFALATQHYMQYHNIVRQDNWTTMGPSVCRYVSEMEHCGVEHLSMKYHTDYDYIRGDEPGDKFAITCTMYLNDDYEGGEMWFNLGAANKDSYGEEPVEGDILKYKPEAGDILVFPSGHPDVLSDKSTYFHAVSRTSKFETKQSDKFFIRSYHMIPFEGTKEWVENQKTYGKENWEKMELERIKARVKTHQELQMIKTKTAISDKECGLY